MSLVYPRRLALASLPTPLEPLRRWSFDNPHAPRIWVKRDDLTGSLLSGNKARKLEFIAAAALDSGCDTLITSGGVQSNHCRATAAVAARLGLKVHLLLRGDDEDIPDGNLLLDLLFGAEVTCFPKRNFSDRLNDRYDQLQRQYSDAGHKAMCVPIGASNGIGIWGYLSAWDELMQDFERLGISPDHVVTATGSGGTQAGLTLGVALNGNSSRVWGINVCDDEAYFRNKIAEDIAEWAALYPNNRVPENVDVNVIEGYVGKGYGHATPELLRFIQAMATCEGLILDPVYTGKACYGLFKEIEKGRFDEADDIVFVHTGGVFGLYPYREQFARLQRLVDTEVAAE